MIAVRRLGYDGERQWNGAWSVLLPPSLHYSQIFLIIGPYIPALVDTNKLEQHPELPYHANAYVCYPTQRIPPF